MLRTSQKKIICLAIKTSELSHINLLNCIHTNIPGLPLSISWPEITSEMSNISTKSDVSYIPLTVHCRCITIRGKKVDKLFSRHTDTDDKTGLTRFLYSPDFSPPPSSPWPSSGRTSSCSPPPPRPPPDTPGSTSALLLLPLRIEDKSINLFPD